MARVNSMKVKFWLLFLHRPYGTLDGWMDELMDEWMDEWMDELMDGWMDGWMDEWMGQTMIDHRAHESCYLHSLSVYM
jgi:hypothetical protein